MARILSHNTTSDTFRNCRQMPMTEEQDQLSLHGGRRGGKSKENRGAKTWLTKIFISREEISVEDRLVKKTTIKINSKVLMLCQQSDKIFQVSQSVTKHWPCNISYLHVWGECTDKKKTLNSGASWALFPRKCIWTFHSSIHKQQKTKHQFNRAKVSNVSYVC